MRLYARIDLTTIQNNCPRSRQVLRPLADGDGELQRLLAALDRHGGLLADLRPGNCRPNSAGPLTSFSFHLVMMSPRLDAGLRPRASREARADT